VIGVVPAVVAVVRRRVIVRVVHRDEPRAIDARGFGFRRERSRSERDPRARDARGRRVRSADARDDAIEVRSRAIARGSVWRSRGALRREN
jgi:hypothetical protein